MKKRKIKTTAGSVPFSFGSDQEGPETRVYKLFLKDTPHLLQHEPLTLAHVLQALLPALALADLALAPNLLQQAAHPPRPGRRQLLVGGVGTEGAVVLGGGVPHGRQRVLGSEGAGGRAAAGGRRRADAGGGQARGA